MSRNTIAAYENNRFCPSESSLTLLAVLYDKPYEWFFGEEAMDATMPNDRQIELGRRLKEARNAAELSQEQVAEVIGSHVVTVSKYERGVQDPNTELLREMARLYGVSVDWLLTGGQGDTETAVRVADPMEGGKLASGEEVELITLVREVKASVDDLVARTAGAVEPDTPMVIAGSRAEYDASDDESTVRPVEVIEVAAAAGGGAEVYDETVVGRLWFRRDWLQSNGLDPAQCNVITVRGESMEPTLPDGCSILVDRSQRRRRRRERRIFVMRTEDGLVVKRAGKDAEGRWQIVSDHPRWGQAPWSDDAEIIGEVRWSAVTH